MAELQAQRTLVKSPPELWAEVSDPDALGRRLADFGEIRITNTLAESIVAWEGERASGTIELAKSGWGTKITLTAQVTEDEEPEIAEPEVVAETPAPVVDAISPPAPRRGFWSRILRRCKAPTPPVVVAAPEPEPLVEPDVEDTTERDLQLEAERVEALLRTVLDDLGAAHHRPFSRG